MRLTGAKPSHAEERLLFAQGFSLVAGIDEAGRGPLAGPVVAAAVVLPQHPKGSWVSLLRDSKLLSSSQREYLFAHLQDGALAAGVGYSASWEIDAWGIVYATRQAMMRALDQLPLQPQFLLIDAMTVPQVAIAQKAITHGDALCVSIAAASIIAKVSRDRVMAEEDLSYPGYGFAQHKGYGTRVHLEKLRLLGPCLIHRRSFAPVRQLLGDGLD